MGPEWKLSAHERPLVACVCVCCFCWQRSSTGPHQPLKVLGSIRLSSCAVPGLSCSCSKSHLEAQGCSCQHTSGSPTLPPSLTKASTSSGSKEELHCQSCQSCLFFSGLLVKTMICFQVPLAASGSQDLCNTERTLVSADLALIRLSGSVQGR